MVVVCCARIYSKLKTRSLMKYGFILMFFFASQLSFCQKIYVWCPEQIEIPSRSAFLNGDTIKVAFFDGRAIPKKSKVECTGDQITEQIFNLLQKTYSNTILIRDDGLYPNRAVSGKYIKIGLSAYHAGLGSEGESAIGFVGTTPTFIFPTETWNGVTIFMIESSNTSDINNETISNMSSQENVWGNRSARKALNASFLKSVQELFFFIDKNL